MITLIENADSARRFKIRIEGRDKNKKNTTRQITVLADSIEEVYEELKAALATKERK